MKRKASTVWKGGLKDGHGTISTESGVLEHPVLVERALTAHKAGVSDIATCLEAGALHRRIARGFPLTEVAAAHKVVKSGQTIGKVLVEID